MSPSGLTEKMAALFLDEILPAVGTRGRKSKDLEVSVSPEDEKISADGLVPVELKMSAPGENIVLADDFFSKNDLEDLNVDSNNQPGVRDGSMVVRCCHTSSRAQVRILESLMVLFIPDSHLSEIRIMAVTTERKFKSSQVNFILW
jgi:hypothetical protein